jgi:hypothetical protein
MKTKLEKFLYRKGVTERLMGIWSKGIKTYSEFVDAAREVAEDESRSPIERGRAAMEVHEAHIPMRHYITSLKLAQREYENHIVPEIEKNSTEEEREGIEFQDMRAAAEKMAQFEVFGYEKRPPNVELIEVNESISAYIELLKAMIGEAEEKLQNESDSYEKAKLNLDIFKWNLQVVSNEKRLHERIDYYNNQFKPKYDADMEEAKIYLEPLLERANEYVKLGIDVKLKFVLDEYEKNKEDKEKVWLFYTALKSRLKKISKEMRRNKGQFKGKMHLAQDII